MDLKNERYSEALEEKNKRYFPATGRKRDHVDFGIMTKDSKDNIHKLYCCVLLES